MQSSTHLIFCSSHLLSQLSATVKGLLHYLLLLLLVQRWEFAWWLKSNTPVLEARHHGIELALPRRSLRPLRFLVTNSRPRFGPWFLHGFAVSPFLPKWASLLGVAFLPRKPQLPELSKGLFFDPWKGVLLFSAAW